MVIITVVQPKLIQLYLYYYNNRCTITSTSKWISVKKQVTLAAYSLPLLGAKKLQLESFNAQLIPLLTRLHVVVPELPQRFCAADFAEIEFHYASCNGNLEPGEPGW